MAPSVSVGEITNRYSMPSTIDVDCLLPNGFLISLNCSRETTLNELKQMVWKEFKKSFCSIDNQFDLKTSENYIFTSVTQEAKTIEYFDLMKRLCDLRLFCPFFQLIEIQGNLEEKALNSDLSKAIGLYISEIEQFKDSELVEFRLELFKFLSSLKQNEKQKTQSDKLNEYLQFSYSANLDLDNIMLDVDVSKTISSLCSFKIGNTSSQLNKIDVNVHVSETNQPQITYQLDVSLSNTPNEVIGEVIKAKLSGMHQSSKQINQVVEKYKDKYLLNVCGCDEVLYGNEHKIGSYKYIKKCITNNKKPNFYLVSIEKMESKLKNQKDIVVDKIDKYINSQENLLEEIKANSVKTQSEMSWKIYDKFNFHIESLVNLPYLKECDKISFKVALYHGQELISRRVETDKIDVERLNKDSFVKINRLIDLDVRISNLHRCSKLCIGLDYVTKKKRESFTVAWISLNLFDYEGYLINGKKKLDMWQTSQSSFSCLCLSNVSGQNPNQDFVRLNVEFLKNRQSTQTIRYPTIDVIKNFVSRTSDFCQDDCFDVSYALENDNNLLSKILNKDALAELSEQEKNVLWRRREDCLNYPHSLPKLLQAVKWTNQNELLEMYSLLNRWQDIKPVVAIELLHSTYADIEVRNFAVRCLDKQMRDVEMQQYLIQLVQSLKNEPYYDNMLARFLLKRALKSQRIGFEFFWNLKSEMKNVRYKYRFGLLLEAYCRGINFTQLKNILKQVDVVEKLSSLAQEIKNNPDSISLVKSSFLQETLEKSDYKETLSNFISPLNRSNLIGLIDSTKCKILTSAKRPLYLTWNNNTDYSIYYQDKFDLIFKHGDDLRQDMLTIQILKLMDIIWKSEGLDLKMLLYDCFTTGFKIGFIEVVTEAKTLFKIQMEGGYRGRYQIDTLQLYKWIQSYNPNEKLNQAVDYFTRSCAGFCVATFILGIGDRHPDNIMVNKEGRLFHIDFGHFLGHFKKKYGIRRERVPFVLTEDFIKVITKGSSTPTEEKEFERFKSLCETAYMIIRRYSHLIINLFMLMLSSEIPELQSIDDIMYLRKTLAVDETDEKALEYFRSQFMESYKHSYTTKLDWMCHALNRKNLI